LRSNQKEHSVPHESLFIGGNHIILDLGRGRYDFDAHLRVKEGKGRNWKMEIPMQNAVVRFPGGR